jgi:hypothetical protein
MKKIYVFALLSLIALNVFSQVTFKTGDVELETDLNTINAKAKVDFGKFKAEMAVKYNIDEKKIEYMHTEVAMEPAEIYLAFEIGKIANKPIDVVIEEYKINQKKGWGVIAKDLGIKPGSSEFHALKNETKLSSGRKVHGNSGKSKGKGKKK